MNNEEIQRTMEFILGQQAQFAANIQRLEEERRRDATNPAARRIIPIACSVGPSK